MSISREEFLRLLPGVVGPRVTIRLVPLPALRFSSLAIPRHRVDITLDGGSDAEGEAFMARFHRAFLRGGG